MEKGFLTPFFPKTAKQNPYPTQRACKALLHIPTGKNAIFLTRKTILVSEGVGDAVAEEKRWETRDGSDHGYGKTGNSEVFCLDLESGNIKLAILACARLSHQPEKTMKTNISLAALLIGMSLGTSHAATVLYSENFDGEGTAGDAHNNGTTPEINVGSIGVLQSTGVSQGNNAGDTAWSLNTPGVGQRGLRFGAGGVGQHNWAVGSNSATILTAGGFSISFDYTIAGTADNWMGVRVGSGGENSAINAGDVTYGVLARGDGRMQTFENGASGDFGTAAAGAPRSAQFNYAFNSWDAGTTVTFTGIIDGNPVATDTFTWDATNDMKIVLAGVTTGTLVDNIVVSTIPEPSSALLGGLGVLALLRRRRN